MGGYTVGVLVQSNFGGILSIAGAPVGQKLGQYYLKQELQQAGAALNNLRGLNPDLPRADGSIIMVVATDAPVDARNLRRMAARAIMGLARTGAAGTNGSGDYAIAFSTAPELRVRSTTPPAPPQIALVTNDAMSPLFEAVIEATEEAIYNSLFRATTVTGIGHTVEALPLDKTIQILHEYRVLAK
jgi:D-aminopeptidase